MRPSIDALVSVAYTAGGRGDRAAADAALHHAQLILSTVVHHSNMMIAKRRARDLRGQARLDALTEASDHARRAYHGAQMLCDVVDMLRMSLQWSGILVDVGQMSYAIHVLLESLEVAHKAPPQARTRQFQCLHEAIVSRVACLIDRWVAGGEAAPHMVRLWVKALRRIGVTLTLAERVPVRARRSPDAEAAE